MTGTGWYNATSIRTVAWFGLGCLWACGSGGELGPEPVDEVRTTAEGTSDRGSSDLGRSDLGSSEGSSDLGASRAGDPAQLDAGARRPTAARTPEALHPQDCQAKRGLERPLPRAGERCYSFPVHGEASPTDTSPFTVPPGEHYHQWYYAIPWPAGSVATRILTAVGAAEVAYFQTTFASRADRTAGDVEPMALGTVLGTDSTVLHMAGAGGCDFELPPDVGLALPSDGLIMVQWHMLNLTGEPQPDNSVVHICTVPEGTRERTASLTVLGTENLGGRAGIAPGQHAFSGRCAGPIEGEATLIGVTPHMRGLGTRIETVLVTADGRRVSVFERAFEHDRQFFETLEPRVVMHPGDALHTTCSYENTTDLSVMFGQSAYSEQCYQVAVVSPPAALSDGASVSLAGALNTCLSF